MATPREQLEQLNRAQAQRLNQRANTVPGGAVPRTPVASGLERVLKQPGELAAETSTPRRAGQIVRHIGDAATGGPILRAGSQVLEQIKPALQEFSAGVTGREPGQINPALRADVASTLNNTVQPPQLGAATQDTGTTATQTTGGGPRVAAPRTTNAQNFLNTTAANRKALTDAGGIQVIRGLQSSIDLPAQSEFGAVSVPEEQLQPGGFSGRARIAAAGGSSALAQSIESRQGAVEAATVRASGVRDSASIRAAASSGGEEVATIQAEIDRLSLLRASGTLSPEEDEALSARITSLNQIRTDAFNPVAG